MNVDNVENGKNDEKTSKQQRSTNTPRGANIILNRNTYTPVPTRGYTSGLDPFG